MHLTLTKPEQDPSSRLEVMKPGERRDVITKLDSEARRKEINIPITEFTDWSPLYDFTWGYFGDGPLRTAFCILKHWTDGDREFAKKYAPEFAVDFVQPLPDKGGTIKADLITHWIDEARTRRPKTHEEYMPKSSELDRIRGQERQAEFDRRNAERQRLELIWKQKQEQRSPWRKPRTGLLRFFF